MLDDLPGATPDSTGNGEADRRPPLTPPSHSCVDGFAITAVHLTLTAGIPGADRATFQELAGQAKAGCPGSKLLNTTITMDATLES